MALCVKSPHLQETSFLLKRVQPREMWPYSWHLKHSATSVCSQMRLFIHPRQNDLEGPAQLLHLFILVSQDLEDVSPPCSFQKTPRLLFFSKFFFLFPDLRGNLQLSVLVEFKQSMNNFTSTSCKEERVGIVRNGCTLRPQSYPSFLRSNFRLAGPRIHGWTRLARGNTDSEVCVQYELPD